jgi:hypothetical protein
MIKNETLDWIYLALSKNQLQALSYDVGLLTET